MLFDDYKSFTYKFPEPQYLGAKYAHLDWIRQFIPQGINTVLDAFAGSQSVSFLFKQLGFQTLTNDFLNFNYQIGKALIENQNEQLNEDDLTILFQKSPNKKNLLSLKNFLPMFSLKQNKPFFLIIFGRISLC